MEKWCRLCKHWSFSGVDEELWCEGFCSLRCRHTRELNTCEDWEGKKDG